MPDIVHKYNHIASAVLLLFSHLMTAQNVEYRISRSGISDAVFSNQTKATTDNPDSLKETLVRKLVDRGFLDAKAMFRDSASVLIIEVTPGVLYVWGDLSWSDVPSFLERELAKQSFISKGKPFTKSGIDSLYNFILEKSEKEGYPFAQVGLNNIDATGTSISAALIYSTNQQVVYAPIEVKGGIFKPSFLQNFLLIREGAVYNQQDILEIPARVETLPFAKLVEVPEVVFNDGVATVSLKPDRIPANQIDAIIGVLPNERGEGLRITGQVDLELTNLFRSAKVFELHWRSFQEQTQDLNLQYLHPAFFGSALDASLQFELLRQDTSFLNRRLLIAFQTRNFKKQSVGFFFDLNGSSSIGEDRTIQSFSMNYAGARYRFSTLRSRWPKDGISIEAAGAVGLKSIQSDSLSSSTQMKGTLEFKYYYTTRDALQLYARAHAGLLVNDQLFINDAYRVGGLQSLRGFNENEFFTTRYAAVTAEFRLLLSNNGYLYGFYDQGFLSLDVENSKGSDTPFGFGVGALLNAGAGMLNLAFALGRSNLQPLAFEFSKIHFGYVVVF